MHCANHPDIAALATCATCGQPLCSLCAHFYQGRAYCAEHYAAVTGQPALASITGRTVPLPGPAGPGDTLPAPPPGGLLVGAPLAPPGTARLEPLPMHLRPGWSQDELVRPPSGAENFGIAGIVLAVVSLPMIFCCGLLGLPVSVIALILGIMALAQARAARDPQQARTFGAISLGLGFLALLGNAGMAALTLFGLYGGRLVP